MLREVTGATISISRTSVGKKKTLFAITGSKDQVRKALEKLSSIIEGTQSQLNNFIRYTYCIGYSSAPSVRL